jgi:hypothetical protein
MKISRFKQIGLLALGALLGAALTLNYPAVAQREREPLPVEDLRAFTEIFGKIKSDYVEPVEDKKLLTEAINGMLSGLDPHSAYLDPEAFKELQVGTQGEFGGLGIEVGTEDGAIKVIAPIDDTPAARAGIKAGDLIIKIDDRLTRGMTLTEAVKLMRGKPRTNIVLTIARKGEPKPLEFKLTRDIIKVQSVKSRLIEPGYAFVRISQFQERTAEDLAKHLTELFKQGPLKGLVLDLRNKLDAMGLYDRFEVERVAKVAVNPKATQGDLDAAIGPVSNRLLTRFRQAQQAWRAGADGTKAREAAKAEMDVLLLFKRDLQLCPAVRVPRADVRLREHRVREALPVRQAAAAALGLRAGAGGGGPLGAAADAPPDARPRPAAAEPCRRRARRGAEAADRCRLRPGAGPAEAAARGDHPGAERSLRG